MKKILNLATIFLFLVLLLPVFTKGAKAPLPEGESTGITYECGSAGTDGKIIYGNCNFQDLVEGTKKAVNFGARLALSFSVVVLVVVGGRYMFYANNPSERTKTHGMLWKVLIGIAFILAAWLIVTLITTALLGNAVLRSVPNPS